MRAQVWSALCRLMAGLATVSIRRKRPHLHVCLIYHGVIAPGDAPPFDAQVHVSRDILAQHLDILLKLGATPTMIDNIASKVARDEPLPPFSASITFDDAYANVVSNALPLLADRGFTATVFAPVSYVGTDRLLWNDQVHVLVGEDNELARMASVAAGLAPVRSAHELVYALKEVPDEVRRETIHRLEDCSQLSEYPDPGSCRICTEDELRTLHSQGWSVGSHTLTHPILTRLSGAEAVEEIVESRERLARMLDEAPRGFAYPDGAFTDSHKQMVRDAGYEFAVTTEGTPIAGAQDATALSRIYPHAQPARFTCLVTGYEQRARRMLRL